MSSTLIDVSARDCAAVDTLDASFELTERLFELAPVAAYVCDRQGLIVRYNRLAAELWGRAPRLRDPREQFCGSFKLHRLDGGPLSHGRCPMAEVLRTGVPVRNQEVIIERPDGSRVTVLVNIHALRDAAGEIAGAMNCFHDVSERKRLEEDLRASERELDDFFENAVVPLHWVGADGTVLRANQAELELLGYSRADYIGRNIAEFYEDPAAAHAVLERLARGEALLKHPARLRAKDGSIKSVLVSSNAYFRDGRFVHTRCITLDVTEQQHAQAQLQASERRSREILDVLPVAIYTTDPQGRITFFNRAAERFWGHTPELGDPWCGSWRLRWPDGTPMQHDECPMAVAITERRPVRGEQALAERPDGTMIPFLAHPTPLFSADGTFVGAVNALVDMSDCRRNEELTQRLASIVEYSQDAIISKDLNGIVQSWNRGAEQIFGYTAQEMIGRPITTLIAPERHDEERQILERLSRGEHIEHYETLRIRRDGAPVEISLTVSPIHNGAGKVIGASKVARDIGARKRVQQQQELLLREMTHRVKNLFSLVGGMVALSTRSARSPRELAEVLQARLGALSRAHELTLPELGSPELKLDKTTTLEMLLRVIMSPHADDSEQPQRVLASGPQVTLGGSAITSFALLLHELATNAVKYGALSHPQGCVRIDWSVSADELALTWAESGGPPLLGEVCNEGFGSLLAHQTVVSQFQGQITRDWRREGLVVRLTARLPRLLH